MNTAVVGSARWRIILIVLVIAEITSAFEVGMMYAALATVMREFRDPAGTGWLITAFLLVGSVSAALCSRLGDLYGRKRLVLLMLACATSGSLIAAFASSLPPLIAGRAVQGFSVALLPLCIGLVREHLPAPRVPVAIGWLAAMASFSAGSGIVLGGWVVDEFGWRSIFWFSAGHAAIALICVAVVLPASTRQAATRQLDVLGGVLLAPAVASLLWAITRLKGSGLDDPLTLTLTAVGLVALVLWLHREWHHPNPMIDVRRLGERQLGLTMLLMALFGLGTSQLMLVILLVGQQPAWTGIGLGLSATFASMLKIPASLAGLVGAPWSGHVAARHGARRAALIGALLVCAGWSALTLRHDAVWLLVALSLVITFGGAMLYAAMPNLVVEVAPPERTSEINGMSHVVRTLGTAIGTQFATVLLASSTVSDLARGSASHPSPAAFEATFLFITACAAACIAVAWALPRRGARAATQPATSAATPATP
jgi:MFS family permease